MGSRRRKMSRREGLSLRQAAHRKVSAGRCSMRRISELVLLARAGISPHDAGKTCRRLLVAALLLIGLAPSLVWACACGCGVFEVATPSLLPTGTGAMVWTEYEFMNQYINWHATTPASGFYNNDKKLATNFVTVGGQYMFDRSWARCWKCLTGKGTTGAPTMAT